EYSFWHLLVRDVAYSQIPRAERARRHRSAAAWIERKAGERVEDLAELLAHHYLQALELAGAAGDTEQAEDLAAPAPLSRARRRTGARSRYRPGRGADCPSRPARSASAASPASGSAMQKASLRWSGRSPCSPSGGRAGMPPSYKTTSLSPATGSRGPRAR